MLNWLKEKSGIGASKSQSGQPPVWVEKTRYGDEDPFEVGPYSIIQKIGQGGMGRVFSCERADSPGQRYALKQLLSMEATEIERFKREIQIGLKLRHPQVCSVNEWGISPDGRYYLVMDLLVGEPLSSTIERLAPMPLDKACAYTAQILTGLEAVHKAGIVHRDLKPANIWVMTDDSIKIMDFGLATGMGPSVTKTGQSLGTLQFLAPEQLMDSKRVDLRADLYNIGFITFLMLTGHLPIEGTMEQTINKMMEGSYTPITEFRTDLPPAVLTWFAKLLQFDPDERFANAAAVRDAMQF